VTGEAGIPKGKHAWQATQTRSVTIVCTLFFLAYLGNSLWLSLFPNYLLRLGMSSVSIGVTLMVYNASLSLAFLPSGRLSDSLGRRPMIVAGSALLALSTLFLGLVNQPSLTLAAVVGSGIGLALLVPSGNALVSDIVSGHGSGLVFALYQIATLSGAVVGSFTAGRLAESIGFSSMFFVSAGFGGITSILGYTTIPETLAARTGKFASAVTESLRSSVSGTARMLRSNSELAILTGALVVHVVSFSMINPFIPLFAEKGIGLDIAQVGMIIGIWNAGVAIAQIPSGHLTDRFGARALLLVHFVLSSFSWTIYAWSWNFESGIAAMLFFGVVAALDMPARRTLMIEFASAKAGKATVIGSLDAITGTVGIVGPVIGGLAWAHIGYAGPFELAGLINAFACLPLIVAMRRRVSSHSPSSASGT